MSGFFKENNSLAFKNRSNIFAAKLRPLVSNDELEAGLFEGIYENKNNSDDLEITEVRLLDGENTVVAEKSLEGIDNTDTIQPPPPPPITTTVQAIAPMKKSGTEPGNTAKPLKYKIGTPLDSVLQQENSNDVLLAAFTNTQRICSSLKSQLSDQEKENSKLKSEITEYESKFNNINEKLVNYKTMLSSLKQNLNEATLWKKSHERTIQEYKTMQETINRKLKILQDELEEIRPKLSKTNETIKDYENDMYKKNGEIEYLKRELDETSGLLSEEKIKNNKIFTLFKEEKENLMWCWNNNLGNLQAYIGILFQHMLTELSVNLLEKDQRRHNKTVQELENLVELQISRSNTRYV